MITYKVPPKWYEVRDQVRMDVMNLPLEEVQDEVERILLSMDFSEQDSEEISIRVAMGFL